PAQDLLIIRGVLGKALAATVADGRGRLEQEQALFRFFPVDARLAGSRLLGGEDLVNPALDDPGVIVARVQSVERELEGLLALDAAVAMRGIAATLGKDSANVAGETERVRFPGSFDSDASAGPQLSKCGVQLQFPVRLCHDPARLVQGGKSRPGEG